MADQLKPTDRPSRLPAILRAIIALGSLAALTTGLWWERPSVALVVSGALVLTGCLYGHFHSRSDTPWRTPAAGAAEPPTDAVPGWWGDLTRRAEPPTNAIIADSASGGDDDAH